MSKEIQLKLPLLTNSYPKVIQPIRSTKTDKKVIFNQMAGAWSNSKKSVNLNFNSESSILLK